MWTTEREGREEEGEKKTAGRQRRRMTSLLSSGRAEWSVCSPGGMGEKKESKSAYPASLGR